MVRICTPPSLFHHLRRILAPAAAPKTTSWPFSTAPTFPDYPETDSLPLTQRLTQPNDTESNYNALHLFAQMHRNGSLPQPSDFSTFLSACAKTASLSAGEQAHAAILKLGLEANVFIGSALIDDSRRVFDEMQERNVVTWTSMVTGYAQHQQPIEAMVLVRQMRRLSVRLNNVTYSSLLSSFCSSNDLDHGKQVHGQVIREGLESDAYVVTTLITMYSKCGSMEDFCKMCPLVAADQISCNSIIAGFSHLGNDLEVIRYFSKMRKACIDADYFTYASVLRAIGILSALEEGKQTHALVLKTGYASNLHAQNGLVSMYARCGMIDNSKQVFFSMSGPNLVSWNSLLSGCAQHGYGSEAWFLPFFVVVVVVVINATIGGVLLQFVMRTTNHLLQAISI
ncbi:pentatricopeptide repeat-containing protein, chloroplastic-like protein [Cinnamomum micranthum f. kanehirae]|uniref:Pentatricopeptide repeat-containing protein, chloroplastic-like protein n=1 Tax=Cinnamomum micranthum f. kanehirae TaxID=337451 RepID=A0A3S3MGZ2_9MAGN|nr:pentatricopeptide repeat-containing protein, chloroplastic-like protein [Cinnamomum micranthum f. kanehirae]